MKGNPFFAVTREEKAASLSSLLKNFHHKSEVFLPTNVFYETTGETHELTTLTKQLCMWLGVKPLNLNVKFAYLPGTPYRYSRSGSEHSIVLSDSYQHQPLQRSALLARAITEYYLNRQKYTPQSDPKAQNEFIELATLQLGFGILILNGSYEVTLARKLLSTHLIREPNPGLRYFTIIEYRELFSQHTKNKHHTYAGHLVPWVRKRREHIVMYRPESIKRIESRIVVDRFKRAGGLVCFMSIVALVAFIYSERPVMMPANLVVQKEKIEVLRISHQACIDSVARKQQELDTTDYFLSREIDAHLNRCISIRNLYNYEVNDYNGRIAQLTQ